MVLFLIGLGLGDERDVTIKGRDAIASCSKVFLEAYTSVLGVDVPRLEELYGKKMVIADRELVESEADRMLVPAKTENVAFLVVGDPLCATTHMDLTIRAREMGIETQVIHNASIMNAAGCCGLQLYNFGQTVSIPFFTEDWRPDSFYEKIAYNAKGGMHTLALLDIKVKEPNFEAMTMGKKVYEPPRFMTVNQALEQLVEVEERRGEGVCTREHMAVGLARVGQDTQRIVSGTIGQLLDVDFGPPLHSLVLCGEMHELEADMFKAFDIAVVGAAMPAAEGEGEGEGSTAKALAVPGVTSMPSAADDGAAGGAGGDGE